MFWNGDSFTWLLSETLPLFIEDQGDLASLPLGPRLNGYFSLGLYRAVPYISGLHLPVPRKYGWLLSWCVSLAGSLTPPQLIVPQGRGIKKVPQTVLSVQTHFIKGNITPRWLLFRVSAYVLSLHNVFFWYKSLKGEKNSGLREVLFSVKSQMMSALVCLKLIKLLG